MNGLRDLPLRPALNRVVVTEVHEKALDHEGALDEINAIVTAAVNTWDIPARVKRLALPSYKYTHVDGTHLVFIGAWRQQKLIGVAALEPDDVSQQQHDRRVMRLQGLFVDPNAHGQGIGSKLVEAAKRASRNRGCDELRVRAERNAAGFFVNRGFQWLAADDRQRGYPHQLAIDLVSRSKLVA